MARPQGLDQSSWQTWPANRWAYSHMDQVLDTVPVRPSTVAADLPVAGSLDLREIVVHGATTALDALAVSHTDGFLVLHEGAVVHESYRDPAEPGRPHLLMSVTKSVVGMVAGALVASGDLSPEAVVESLVPELSSSGYRGADLRTLLDMRSGVAYVEDYVDEDSPALLLEEACGWRPRAHPALPRTLRGYLGTLGPQGRHGGPFVYRSSDTDVLAWMCERAGGAPLQSLVQDLVWVPMGAQDQATWTVDSERVVVADGGLSATLRDAARFGEVLRRFGAGPGGTTVVPESWARDTLVGAADSRPAFAGHPYGTLFRHYRNQIWITDEQFVCIGIHGQMVFVAPETGMTAVKVSSWPTARSDRLLPAALDLMRAVSRALS